MIRVNIDKVYYTPEKKTFSGEASEMGIGDFPGELQLYNPKTNNVVGFSLSVPHRDSDGDLTHADYVSRPNTFGHFKLTVFND